MTHASKRSGTPPVKSVKEYEAEVEKLKKVIIELEAEISIMSDELETYQDQSPSIT